MSGCLTFRSTCCFAALLLAVAGASSCSESPAGPRLDDEFEIVFRDLPAVPVDQGQLEVWVRSDRDTVSVGRVLANGETTGSLRFTMPIGGARGVLVTLEPPTDADARPSRSVLLSGAFKGGRALLAIEGSITDGRPLEDAPGAHSLFTTSNNVELGYPSFENAGLWLFSVAPSRNRHGTREVKLTPLRTGWIYEGWIVRPAAPAIWISYGKYRPDELGLLTSRDDSGAGPFSGDEDFRNAGVEDVPGEEWTTDRIALQLGIVMPAGLDIPLALDSVDPAGAAVWHHVITIEPAFDAVEAPLQGRPFVVRPYVNAIGAGGPGEPRVIQRSGPVPTAEVRRIN